jgi:hypothetical protein
VIVGTATVLDAVHGAFAVGVTVEAHAFAITPAAAGTCPERLVAVRRFYNNPAVGADMNDRYVTSAAVAAEMRGKGWVEEGVVTCAQP